MRRGSLAVFLAAMSLCARSARSAPAAHEPVKLEWRRDSAASAACPTSETIEADVSQRLGFSPFIQARESTASISVEVSRARGTWRADVVMRERDGSLRGGRRVESRAVDCQSLASATALAMALMIDPELFSREHARAATTVPPVAPQRRDASPAVPRPPARLHGSMAIGIAGAVSLLPRPALGPLLRVELTVYERLALAIDAQSLLEQKVARAGAEGHVGLLLAGIGPCYRLRLPGDLGVATCASLLMGAVSLSIAKPSPLSSGARSWLGATTGLRAGYRSRDWSLELSASVVGHWGRREYLVARLDPKRTEPFYRESAVAGLGSVALGAVF